MPSEPPEVPKSQSPVYPHQADGVVTAAALAESVANNPDAYHQALMPHIQALLDRIGVQPELGPEEPLDIEALAQDIVVPRYMLEGQGDAREKGEVKQYGLREWQALVATDKYDLALSGIRGERFRGLDESVVAKLEAEGNLQLVAASAYLPSFTGLSMQTAEKLLRECKGAGLLAVPEAFVDYDEERCIDLAIENRQYAITRSLANNPNYDLDALAPRLREARLYDELLEGVELGRMPSVKPDELVETMVSEHAASKIINDIERLPDVDRAALAQRIVADGTPEELDVLVNNARHFPEMDKTKAFERLYAEPHDEYSDQKLLCLLTKQGGKDVVSTDMQQKLIDRMVANNEFAQLIRAYNELPVGLIDKNKLAQGMATAPKRSDAVFESVELLCTLIHNGCIPGLNGETYDVISSQILPENLEDITNSFCLDQFEYLGEHALADLMANGDIKLMLMNAHKIPQDLEPVVRAVFSKLDEGSWFFREDFDLLAEKLDVFSAQHDIVWEEMLRQGRHGTVWLQDNLLRLTDLDLPKAVSVALQSNSSAQCLVMHEATFFGLSDEEVKNAFRAQGGSLARLADNEKLWGLLQTGSVFGPVVTKDMFVQYMETEHPEQIEEAVYALSTGDKPLWNMNLLWAKAKLGDIGMRAFLPDYTVMSIPVAMPTEAAQGTYASNAVFRNIAEMDADERAMYIAPGALGKTDITFADLLPLAQETLLGFRLYEAVGKSRDEEQKAHTSEINRRFAEAAQWWYADDLVHATGTLSNVRNILRNGFLCGETVGGEQASTDRYPYNVDFVAVSAEVMAAQGHQERLKALKNNAYGSYCFVMHRTSESTDWDNVQTGGMNADHRLVFGAVPSTEISAILLRSSEDVVVDEIVEAVVDSGQYIPVISEAGENLLTYEAYEQRRLDGNYVTVKPLVVDSTFRRAQSQAGSNDGAEFLMPSRQNPGEFDRYYVKFGDESAQKQDHLWTEKLADTIYKTVTPDLVPETDIIVVEGRLGRRSKMIDIDDVPVSDTARNEGFIVDCLLGNWDAVYNNANLIMSGGRAMRIDNGNSFDFRARGDKKPENSFGETVDEVAVESDPSNLGKGMRQMYPGLTDNYIREQVIALQELLPDEKIDELVHAIRRSKNDRDHLSRILKARKRHLVEQYI